jgi:predicted unusual protein kinase regulating ubiquinone biosynthesis (AarF/ABC1/UbiB family)
MVRVTSRFRALALRMGGVMIKVGQFLSSRLDVLPQEVTSVLSSLQDEVPPESYAAVSRLAEAELGAPLGSMFESFHEEPLAAASLGQVHRARLPGKLGSGLPSRDIVVKIQRPGIEELVEVDLSAIQRVARWLSRRASISKRVDLVGLVGEFARVTRGELDYLAEGRNAEAIGASFRGDGRYKVPRVLWERTTRRVLCLEDVFSIRIGDYDGIVAAGLDRGEIARRLIDCYLKQIFDDGFFQADPHPGNLFVTPAGGGEWRLAIVDFGMVGRMPRGLRLALREAVIAVGGRDSAGLVKALDAAGILMPSADRAEIGRALGEALDLVWGKSLSEIRDIDMEEMRRFAAKFRSLLYEMPIHLPSDLLMLGRTIGILSGMCAGLDPNFNLWERLEPYAARIAREEAGSFLRRMLDETVSTLRTAAGLPARLDRALSAMEGGRGQKAPDTARVFEAGSRRIARALVFAALLIGGALLRPALPLLGDLLLGGAALALLWLIVAG